MADSISWLTQYRAFCGVRDNHVTPDKALGKDTCVARPHSTLWALGAQVVHSHFQCVYAWNTPRRNWSVTKIDCSALWVRHGAAGGPL